MWKLWNFLFGWDYASLDHNHKGYKTYRVLKKDNGAFFVQAGIWEHTLLPGNYSSIGSHYVRLTEFKPIAVFVKK